MKKIFLPAILLIIALFIAMCGKTSDVQLLESGRIFENNGDYAKALAKYDMLLRQHPDSPLRIEVFCRAGLAAFTGLEDMKRAESYLKRVADTDPLSPRASGCNALIDFIYEGNIQDKAEVLYLAGTAYANILNDYQMANNVLRMLLERYPDNERAPQALFMVGFNYANNIQDFIQARQVYETFIERYPDHELVFSVRWELEYLGKDINEIPEIRMIDESGLK